tara:strand:- start:2351 stop:2641 length:291 start_codon:yes stop_codon:yes gene_type:complete
MKSSRKSSRLYDLFNNKISSTNVDSVLPFRFLITSTQDSKSSREKDAEKSPVRHGLLPMTGTDDSDQDDEVGKPNLRLSFANYSNFFPWSLKKKFF